MNNKSSNTLNLNPLDEYNQQLIAEVHPSDWVNPTSQDKYDLVVIGAGTAGLVVAAGAAGLGIGLKVALIERYLMGGDCLNFGCVPSKAIIRSAKVIGELAKGRELGIKARDVEINFREVMARMRRLRAGISHHDSASRFTSLGIDVFFGDAHFTPEQTIAVGDKSLHYKKAVIATGARAVKPKIEGIDSTGFQTNETIFSLTELPPRLAVFGGGPIGCELAQAFHRLGSQVILFHKHENLLNREDADAAQILHKRFINEGIELVLPVQILRTEQTPTGKKIYYREQHQQKAIEVDEILMGAGRQPNIETLQLENVGVKYNRRGVLVNDYLQTSNPRIYAAGDVCLDWKFTHTADAAARIVIKNSLFSPFGLGKAKFTDLVVPWVTYTDPEIAHVGMYEADAQGQGIKVDTIKIMMSTVDRAITDEETEGFVKIHHQQGSDRILGATIVASHAGEMISEITAAMVNKIGLNGLSSVIHSYPTQADAIKKAADAYRRKLLTSRTKTLLGFLTKLS